jgi:hypothetical protein
VNAEQSGPWSVDVNGTVDVNVNNTPGVTVQNTSSDPVPVSVVSDIPVSATFTDPSVPFHRDITAEMFTVPQDKMAVVEFISLYCSLPTSANFNRWFLSTTVDSRVVAYSFVLPLVRETTFARIYALTQSTHIYADPGTQLTRGIEGSGSGWSATDCQASISGRLIPVAP